MKETEPHVVKSSNKVLIPRPSNDRHDPLVIKLLNLSLLLPYTALNTISRTGTGSGKLVQ